jgi:hypothetical protein
VFLARSVIAGALSAAVMGSGCSSGEIANPPGGGEETKADATERETFEPRLITEVLDDRGSRYSFHQNVDGSLDLLQQGQPENLVALPEGELDVLAVYRLVAPGKRVPEALLQAERDFRHAQANGLLGTAWLPPGPRHTDAAGSVVEAAAAAADNDVEPIDGNWFRDTYCDPLGDSESRCFIDVTGNWQFSRSKIARRALTLAMSIGAGAFDITYQSCAIGIFCGHRLKGVVQQGHIFRWKSGGHKSSFTYRVQGANSIWHFANTIEQHGP